MKTITIMSMLLLGLTMSVKGAADQDMLLAQTREMVLTTLDVALGHSTRAFTNIGGNCVNSNGSPCAGKCCVSDTTSTCSQETPCCSQDFEILDRICKTPAKREQNDDNFLAQKREMSDLTLNVALGRSTRAFLEIGGNCVNSNGGPCAGKCCVSDTTSTCTQDTPCCSQDFVILDRVCKSAATPERREMKNESDEALHKLLRSLLQ